MPSDQECNLVRKMNVLFLVLIVAKFSVGQDLRCSKSFCDVRLI